MVSRAYIFLTMGKQLARVAMAIADRVQESTPEERAEVARHVAAIYRILQDATERRGDARDFPMLMLGPATPNDNQTQRMERLQNGLRQFRHTFRRYRRNLNREHREQVMSHVRELARIVLEIDARTRVRH